MTLFFLPRLPRWSGALAALLCCFLLLPTHAQDTDDLPVVTRTVAITNARIVSSPGTVMDRATVLVRDGLIEAVGPDVEVPFDARVIAGDSLTIYAGFIDGLSHAGVETPDLDTSEDIENPDDPPPARAGILPDRKARALLKPDDSSVSSLREVGFTTAHVVPEGQMLPGQGALVQLAGEEPTAMILEGTSSMFFQLESAQSSWPNVVAPGTEMAVIATLRDLVRETERRQAIMTAYEENPRGRQRPPTDAVHDALLPVTDGSLPVVAYTEDALDLHRVLALQSELDLSMMLTGLSGSFRAVETLQNTDAPLFLTLDLPEAPDDEGEDADTTAADTTQNAMTPEGPGSFFQEDFRVRSHEDIEDEEQNLKARQGMEREKYYRTAATLHEAGLRFGFMSKDAKASDIRDNLRTMIEHGLSEDAALAALTTDAASLLGVDDRLGTVEEGKIANLVITDGNYFEEDTKVRHVVVDGRLFDISTAEEEGEVTGSVAAVMGTWQYTIESPQGKLSGTITLEESGSGLEGTISSPTGEGTTELQAISFDGSSLSFSFDSGNTGAGEVTITVTIEGDSFEGSASTAQYGSFPITGTRTSSPE